MAKRRCCIAVATAFLPLAAQASEPTPRPFLPDRTAEDYSHLADPSRHGDWSDGYKFIPLGGGGTSYLSLGGEFRERLESFDAPRFGLGGATRDTYLLQRILVHADVRLGPNVRIFAQLGALDAFSKEQLAAPDEDHLDVQQLFIELRPASGLALRLGRQELAFNPAQRFVSFRDGTNVRQTFDGGRLTWSSGRLRLEAFLVRPVAPERGAFDNETNTDQKFAGLYASLRMGRDASMSFDSYWFLLERDDPAIGRERRHSIGLRHAGTRGRTDWDVEALYQFGRSGSRTIGAWAASADLGYTFIGVPLRPRLGLQLDAGSGDRDPADGRLGSFHPLFPKGPYFNEANLVSWTNQLAFRPGLRIQPEPRLTVQGTVQFRWRESRGDAVYLGPAAALAATRANNAREIGQVITLDANFQLNRNLALRAYYLHHSAGEAISRAGGRNVDFAMASATFRF